MFFDSTGDMLAARETQSRKIVHDFGTTVLPIGTALTQRQSQDNQIRAIQGRPPRYAHMVIATTSYVFHENSRRLDPPRVEHTYRAPKGLIALIPAGS